MTLERRLAVVTAISIALTLFFGGYILLSDSKANLTEAEKLQIEANGLVLISAMGQAENLALSHAELIARDPGVVAEMKAADRPALQVRMKPVFETLNQTVGADVLHFHTVDMKSFLRVWQPDDFGQDLSRIRPMVLSANRSGKPQKGLEIGLKGLSLRAVSAIRDSERVIGTVEIGLDLKTLMEQAKATTGADFAIYLAPDMIPDGKGGFGAAAGSLVLDAATDRALFDKIEANDMVRMARAQTLDIATIDARPTGVLGSPVLDYSGRMIGMLMVAHDVAGLEAGYRATFITVIVVALSGLLISYGVFMIAIRAFIARPLEKLVAECRAGDVDEAASKLEAYLGLKVPPVTAPDEAGESDAT